jgi:CheY-like chemotaxis protein
MARSLAPGVGPVARGGWVEGDGLSFFLAAEPAHGAVGRQNDGLKAGSLLADDPGSPGGSQATPDSQGTSDPLWAFVFAQALTQWPGRPKGQSAILVVEGDEATRDALTVLFVEQGYLVQSAGTARDALNVLRTPLAPVDVVLLDLDLPDVHGLQLCERVRQLYPKLPVVVCTNDAEPAAVTQLLQLGVQTYVRKPIEGAKLLTAVQALLR